MFPDTDEIKNIRLHVVITIEAVSFRNHCCALVFGIYKSVEFLQMQILTRLCFSVLCCY